MPIPNLLGWWCNYSTGRLFLIDEHQHFIRRAGNAKKLGVPAAVIRQFSKFKEATDRNKFLLFVMMHSPLMRVRMHREHASFEYASGSDTAPLKSILAWCNDNAGPLTNLRIVNLKTDNATQISFQDFEAAMKRPGGAEEVFHVPQTTK